MQDTDHIYKKVEIANGAILGARWANSGTGSAPDPELYKQFAIGCDLNGISTASTYHVIGDIGAKVWVATGATVANAYGAA